MESGKDIVLELMQDKSQTKAEICSNMQDVFGMFKKVIAEMTEEYKPIIEKFDHPIRFGYLDHGEFECELHFGGDLLYFTLHSNIFNFEPTHHIFKDPYVAEDPSRAYCGMIQIHNFLFDSIRYLRPMDMGYLIGRIFVNNDKFFFIEGKRQLGFLYDNFSNAEINEVYIRGIIESAMIYTLDFDLLVPPYESVQEITVNQKIHQSANSAFRTGKRVGFKFQYEQHQTS